MRPVLNQKPIDVVIPVRNGERHLAETLESLLCQTLPAAEIVVVENGSTDGTWELLQRFPGIRAVQSFEKGPDPARLVGLKLTRSPYVALIDHDDVLHPEHLENLHDALEANPQASAALSSVICFQDDGTPDFAQPAEAPSIYDPWALFPCNAILTPSCVLMRRELLERAGGWPLRFLQIADFHAWLILGMEGPFAHTGRPTLAHRDYAESLSASFRSEANQIAYFEERIACCRDVLGTHSDLREGVRTQLKNRMQTIERLGQMMFASPLERIPTTAWKQLESCFSELSAGFRYRLQALATWHWRPELKSSPHNRFWNHFLRQALAAGFAYVEDFLIFSPVGEITSHTLRARPGAETLAIVGKHCASRLSERLRDEWLGQISRISSTVR